MLVSFVYEAKRCQTTIDIIDHAPNYTNETRADTFANVDESSCQQPIIMVLCPNLLRDRQSFEVYMSVCVWAWTNLSPSNVNVGWWWWLPLPVRLLLVCPTFNLPPSLFFFLSFFLPSFHPLDWPVYIPSSDGNHSHTTIVVDLALRQFESSLIELNNTNKTLNCVWTIVEKVANHIFGDNWMIILCYDVIRFKSNQ